MLFQPTNVYPNKNTFEIKNESTYPISFTLNGDKILYRDFRVYDANTRNLVKVYYGWLGEEHYRGETFTSYMPTGNDYSNGKDYMWNVRLFQEQFDILKVTGAVRNSGLTHGNETLYVSYGVTGIVEPVI